MVDQSMRSEALSASRVSHNTNATRRTRRDGGGNYGDKAMEAYHKQTIDTRSNKRGHTQRKPGREDKDEYDDTKSNRSRNVF